MHASSTVKVAPLLKWAGGKRQLLGALAEVVDARRVTIRLSQAGHQRLENFWRDWGCGVVIEVEMLHLVLF